MKTFSKFMLSCALCLVTYGVQAQDSRTQVIDNGGSGSYKAIMTSD